MCFNKNIAATALIMNFHRDTVKIRQEILVTESPCKMSYTFMLSDRTEIVYLEKPTKR